MGHLTAGLEPLRGCTALQVLNLNNNLLNGGLGPLRGYTALRKLDLSFNQMGHLTDGLEPLRGCKALCELSLENDQLVPSVEDMAHYQEQCGWAEQEDGESDSSEIPLLFQRDFGDFCTTYKTEIDRCRFQTILPRAQH